MVQSMTGFGRSEKKAIRIEVRSVNHRYLDVYMRSPSFLSSLEIPFRNILKENFARGKFDISLIMSMHDAEELTVNSQYVRKIHQVFSGLKADLGIGGDIDINSLISLHDMFIETSPTFDMDEITGVFREALNDLLQMRLKEGETLTLAIRGMTEALSGMAWKVKALSGKIVVEMKDKFTEKLKALLEGNEIESSRLLQEAAILAARLDIAEELARIDSHLGQFNKVLSEGGAIGRKLDFILQELNREVNTIASKSADYEISSIMVDMKTEIEKIREQVQNIQ